MEVAAFEALLEVSDTMVGISASERSVPSQTDVDMVSPSLESPSEQHVDLEHTLTTETLPQSETEEISSDEDDSSSVSEPCLSQVCV